MYREIATLKSRIFATLTGEMGSGHRAGESLTLDLIFNSLMASDNHLCEIPSWPQISKFSDLLGDLKYNDFQRFKILECLIIINIISIIFV